TAGERRQYRDILLSVSNDNSAPTVQTVHTDSTALHCGANPHPARRACRLRWASLQSNHRRVAAAKRRALILLDRGWRSERACLEGQFGATVFQRVDGQDHRTRVITRERGTSWKEIHDEAKYHDCYSDASPGGDDDIHEPGICSKHGRGG